jgi:DNA replicative helicase MCM subunit Mcm2 (Cdc46/Mcm family)
LSQLAKLLLKLAKQERFDIDFAGVPHDRIYRTLRLASNGSLVKFVPMIPRFTSYAVSLLAIAFLIPACASRDESVIEERTSQSEATVGDEKVPDRPAFVPGSQGTSAQHGL